jgi:hypothetical protein
MSVTVDFWVFSPSVKPPLPHVGAMPMQHVGAMWMPHVGVKPLPHVEAMRMPHDAPNHLIYDYRTIDLLYVFLNIFYFFLFFLILSF